MFLGLLVHPPEELFMAHAKADRQCTVQVSYPYEHSSTTPLNQDKQSQPRHT